MSDNYLNRKMRFRKAYKGSPKWSSFVRRREAFKKKGLADQAAASAAFTLHRGALLSVNEIVAQATTKKRLGQSSGALAVDMETYRIGQVAAKHHISFVGLRTIFDACDDDVSLPITQCMTPDGVLQPGRLLRDLIRQPSLLAQLLPLWRKARTAGHHLETWLYRFLTLLSPEG